jgi:hypothetical protein
MNLLVSCCVGFLPRLLRRFGLEVVQTSVGGFSVSFVPTIYIVTGTG